MILRNRRPTATGTFLALLFTGLAFLAEPAESAGPAPDLAAHFPTETTGPTRLSFSTWNDRIFLWPDLPETGSEPWILSTVASATRTFDATPLADLCPGPCSEFIRLFVRLSDRFIFGTSDQLWTSDGTPEGTQPGSLGDAPTSSPSTSVVWNDRWLFIAWDREDGHSLWTSDGSAAGTQLLAPAFSSAFLVATDGGVYFIGETPETGAELWITDGTPEGTRMVTDLRPGPESGLDGGRPINFGGELLFAADNGRVGTAIWLSDGTPEGTRMVADLRPGRSPMSFVGIAASGGHAFFRATPEPRFASVWVTDGTAAGTRQLFDRDTAAEAAVLESSARVFFVPWRDRRELWTATPEGGVERIATFPNRVDRLVTRGGTLWIRVFQNGGLWRWRDGELDQPDLLHIPARHGETSLVVVRDPELGSQLHRLEPDDTTTPITRLSFGQARPFRQLLDDAGTLRFVLGNGRVGVADGSTAETTVLGKVSPQARWVLAGERRLLKAPRALWELGTDGEIRQLEKGARGTVRTSVSVGEHLVWIERDRLHLELRANGLGGTQTLAEDDSFAGCRPRECYRGGIALTSWQGRAYAVLGRDLWSTDGTPEGTERLLNVAELCPSCDARTRFGALFATPEKLWLATTWPNAGLWTGDGTVAGTERIHGLGGSGTDARLLEMTEAGGLVYFVRQRARSRQVDDFELWRSDGTRAGTRRVRHFVPGQGNVDTVRDLVSLGNRLAFTAETAAHGREAWITDGTGAGTHVLDVRPGPAGSEAAELRAVDGHLLFQAGGISHGKELWISDGTPEGTRLLVDTEPGALPSNPADMTASGTRIYFRAWTRVRGEGLWSIDRNAINSTP